MHEKLVRTLLVLDSVRGEDSTGVCTIGKFDEKPKIAKQVGDPFQLFDHKSFDKVFVGLQRAIIGHNRWATTGAVNRNNAHPFENDGVVGVHNGTLSTKHLLDSPGHFQVDSENLFHHIAKFGLDDALKFMGGAWALVWWDKDDYTLNFLRNKERPLYVAYSKNQECMFWASEPWMLIGALNKHNLDYDSIELLPADLHICVPINAKGEMVKPTARKAPSTYVPPVTTYKNGNNGYWNKEEEKKATNVTPLPDVKKEEHVVAPPKKQENVLVESSETFYINAKNRRLETLNSCKDVHGQEYIACFDPLRQYFDVRIYAKKDSPLWDAIGCEMYGNVCGYSSDGVTPGRGYYKIDPKDIVVIAPTDTEGPTEIMGPTGRWLTKDEFRKTYPDCGYCSSPLDIGDANRFTTAGECVCPSCAKDPEVLKFVSLS